MDFRKTRQRRKAVLSYLKTRKGERFGRRLDGKREYLARCLRPLLPAIFAAEKLGRGGEIRYGLVGLYRCKDRLCPACAPLLFEGNREELSAGVWEGVKAGRSTWHVVLTIKKPLDVGGFEDEADVATITAFWQLLRKSWGELSRRGRSGLWASHFRATDWTASPGLYVNGERQRAGLFPHYHLIVQCEEKRDALAFAREIHTAWVKAVAKVVREARIKDAAAYPWIDLAGVFCQEPSLEGGEVRGGVHVRAIERDDEDSMRRAIDYAACELVAADVKEGKRKNAETNRLNSYTIGELLDLRGTKLEGFARSAFRLFAALTYGIPGHMYSRERKNKAAIRVAAQERKRERKSRDVETRLEGVELHERAVSDDLWHLLKAYGEGVSRGLDEWQTGFYLPEAVPAFKEDDRSQAEKRKEIADALARLKEGYRNHVKASRDDGEA